MLLLAVHSLQEPSAKVPFAMVTLLDAIKKNQVPAGLKCRQVLPSNGTKSASLWDADDKLALQEWLDEFLDADCNSEVFEVQEDFTLGISSELARSRATERVTNSTKATAQAVQERTQKAAAGVQQTVGDIDSRLKVSEHAAAAYKSARESQVAKKTSEVLGGVSQKAQQLSKQALEDKRVAAMNANISAGWKSLSSTVGGFMGRATPQSAGQPVQTTPVPNSVNLNSEPPKAGGKEPSKPAPTRSPARIEDPFTIDDAEAEEKTKLASPAANTSK